jgi:hypothetical protein
MSKIAVITSHSQGDHPEELSFFSPFALADVKRKRLLLGTGIVQLIFGGFLLLPVLFVLSRKKTTKFLIS